MAEENSELVDWGEDDPPLQEGAGEQQEEMESPPPPSPITEVPGGQADGCHGRAIGQRVPAGWWQASGGLAQQRLGSYVVANGCCWGLIGLGLYDCHLSAVPLLC